MAYLLEGPTVTFLVIPHSPFSFHHHHRLHIMMWPRSPRPRVIRTCFLCVCVCGWVHIYKLSAAVVVGPRLGSYSLVLVALLYLCSLSHSCSYQRSRTRACAVTHALSTVAGLSLWMMFSVSLPFPFDLTQSSAPPNHHHQRLSLEV